MDFPFKTYPQVQFKNTFLERVICFVSFEAEGDSFELYKTFIKDQFGLDFSKEMYEGMSSKPVQLSSSPEGIEWQISNSEINIKVDQEVYASFQESMKPMLMKALSFIETLDAANISLELKKVNLYGLPDEDENNYKEFEKAVLSPNVTACWKDEFLFLADGNSKMYKNSFSQDNCKIDIYSGFLDKDGDDIPRFVLDITGSSDVLTHDRERSVNCLNDYIDTVFRNCITESLVEMMVS